MKLYNATVRLGGSISNEVNVEKITAAEIAVLQRIHGADAVQKIVEVGSVKGRSDAKERARLATAYPKGMSADNKTPLEGHSFIASIFGVSGVALPTEYVPPVIDETEEVESSTEEEIEVLETLEKPIAIKRTPPRKIAPREDANALVA
jgi:hypothetical protein